MMRLYFFSLLIVGLFAGCDSEKVDPIIEKHIRLWQKTGIDQSIITYEVVADLINRQDSALFEKEILALYNYLGHHPDKRIEAQTLLYHVLGSKLLRLTHIPDVQLLDKAALLAEQLGDEMLSSEIYAVYATLYGHDGTYLFYSLKSLEIQEKFGLEYFTYVQNRFFDISRTLLNAKEYRKSIYYGMESLRQVMTTQRVFDTGIYVYIFDILGNDYLHLNELDSAQKYFSLGLEYTPKIFTETRERNLWVSIFTGNAAQVDYLKGDYQQAIQKTFTHFDTAFKYEDHLNIAIAGNRLGDLYLREKEYIAAEKYFRLALESAQLNQAHAYASYAANKLRDLSIQQKHYQKALEYEQLFTRFTQEHQQYLDLINLNRLQAIQQIERTQGALAESKAELEKEKVKRNNITYLFLFLFIIAVAITLRMRMRNQHRVLMSKKEKETFAIEMAFSEAQIQNFKNNIIEKNKLIEELSAKVNISQKTELNQSLFEQTLITEKEWERFKLEFLKVYPHFQKVVKEHLPHPTPAEQRLLSLIVLGLDHQQIGNALGISKDSVARSKRRLRHRLMINGPIDLEELLKKIS
jgi:tetratricopeptide (TPR) repeat protein/DNA-binding NarL/FixJ family response regulator